MLAAFSGCGSKEQTGAAQQEATDSESALWGEAEAVPFAQKAAALRDSLQSLLQQAEILEENKINIPLQLIGEIEAVVPNPPVALLGALRKKQAEVARARYSQATMQVESVMETYDARCEELVDLVQQVLEAIPDMERYSRANLLALEVLEANRSDFMVRKDYNKYAMEWNALVASQKSQLKKALGMEKAPEPMPYFYGEPVM